jgi:hypothetical protein
VSGISENQLNFGIIQLNYFGYLLLFIANLAGTTIQALYISYCRRHAIG